MKIGSCWKSYIIFNVLHVQTSFPLRAICPPLRHCFNICIVINCLILLSQKPFAQLSLKGVHSYRYIIRNMTQANKILLRQMSSCTWLLCPIWLCNTEHITQCWDDCLQVKLGGLCQIGLKCLNTDITQLLD